MIGDLDITVAFCLLRHPLAHFPYTNFKLQRYRRIAGQVEEELMALHYANKIIVRVGVERE